jgi:hypothetical protein
MAKEETDRKVPALKLVLVCSAQSLTDSYLFLSDSLVSDVYDLANRFLEKLGSFHRCKLATIKISGDESAHGHGC